MNPSFIASLITEDPNLFNENLTYYAQDPRSAYDYAKGIGFKNVPDIIVKSIAQNPHYAYNYAEGIRFENVPDIIVESIAQDPHYAYHYARDIRFKNAPDIIVESLAQDPRYAYHYARSIGFENVPDIIVKSMAKHTPDVSVYELKQNMAYAADLMSRYPHLDIITLPRFTEQNINLYKKYIFSLAHIDNLSIDQQTIRSIDHIQPFFDSLQKQLTSDALSAFFVALSAENEFNPRKFKTSAINGIIEQFIEDEIPQSDMFVFANNLASIFNKQWKQWLNARRKRQQENTHDAVYWLKTPQDAKGLKNYLTKNTNQHRKYLEIITTNWDTLKNEEKTQPPKELVRTIKTKIYPNVRNEDFAVEASNWGIPQDKYDELENVFISSVNTPTVFPDKTWEINNLTGSFMSRSDPRGLFLGQHTNCCQHPTGVGRMAALAGQVNATSGFFTIEDKKGKIIAQSWVWMGPDGGLVFDSIEGVESFSGERHEDIVNIYKTASKDLSKIFGVVNVGTSYSRVRLEDLGAATEPIQLSASMLKYTDARNQINIIGDQPVIPKKTPLYWVRFTPDVEELKRPLIKVASALYPSDWQHIPSGHTYALVNHTEDAVGYVTVDAKERSINDLAILPDHRRGAVLLLRIIQSYMQRLPGKWNASLRQTTSYEMLKRLEARGKVKLTELGVSDQMGDDAMIDVEIELNESVKFNRMILVDCYLNPVRRVHDVPSFVASIMEDCV